METLPDDESTTSKLNELQPVSGDSHYDSIEGWLRKKKNRTRTWKDVYGVLRQGMLVYGKTQDSTKKFINIQCANIEECPEEMFGQFCFSVNSRDKKRVHYFRLQSQEEYQRWLETMCYSKIGGERDASNSEACTIQ